MRRALAAIIIAALAATSVPALAQPAPPQGGQPPPSAPEAPTDPLGRTTPAGTVNGFIGAIAARDYKRASQYLDLAGRSVRSGSASAARLARGLQRALDREGTILRATQISNDPKGLLTDGLDPELEHVGTIGQGEAASAILLRRVEREGSQIWLIAQETLDAAEIINTEDTGGVLAESWLPAAVSHTLVAGVPLSHWLTLIGLTALAAALFWMGLHWVLILLRRVGWGESRVYRFLGVSVLPLALLLTLLIVGSTAPVMGISIVARQAYGWLIEVIGPLLSAWLLLRLTDVLSDRILQGVGRRSLPTATSIVRFAGRVAKVVVIAVAVMAVLDAFGFDVTAVLAALGIGGIALALGAQRTVENLIASISIISDRPFRVGDFCKIGDTLGTIEDIGMRSTRVRTLARTMMTIPNSNLVNSAIENFAARDRYLFSPVLYLSNDTPPDRIKALLPKLRAALEGDTRLAGHTARVRLLQPASDRLPIEVFGYMFAADFDDSLAVQEDLTLRLLDAVAEMGLALAPPSIEVHRKKEEE